MIHFLHILCLLGIIAIIWGVMSFGVGDNGQYLRIIQNESIAQIGVGILCVLSIIDWCIIVVWSLVIASGFIRPTWAMITNLMNSLW